MKKVTLFLLSFMLAILIFLPIPIHGGVVNTIVVKVGTNNLGYYNNIQNAVRDIEDMTVSATTNYTISVNPEFYDTTENVIIHQEENKNIVLRSSNESENVDFKGTIRIDGLGRSRALDTLKIEGFYFNQTATTTSVDVISDYADPSVGLIGRHSYAHNVTISNCVFAGNPNLALNNNEIIAFSNRSTDGICNTKFENVTGTHMHSLFQGGAINFYVYNCDLNGWYRGINVYGIGTFEIKNSRIVTVKYCLRLGASSGNPRTDNTCLIENSLLNCTSADGAVVTRGNSPSNVSIVESSVTSAQSVDTIKDSTTGITFSANGNYWGLNGFSDATVTKNSATTITSDSWYNQEDYYTSAEDKLVLSNINYKSGTVAAIGITPYVNISDAITAANGRTITLIDPLTTGINGGTWNSNVSGNLADGYIAIKSGSVWIVYEGHTVAFDSNGGSDVISQEVLEGDLAMIPVAPIKGGYHFGGWYVNSSLTTKYDFSSIVTSNLTLYAKWLPVHVASPNTSDSSEIVFWMLTLLFSFLSATAIYYWKQLIKNNSGY